MKLFQKVITLPAKPRGFHLITNQVLQALPEISQVEGGLCHLFLLHTSASLTINEGVDPSVRRDFLKFTDSLVPEEFPFTHTLEGSDDMPAHIKGSLFGNQLTLPISGGKIVLGAWQGIYLCEHRDFSSNRKIYATIIGT
ncbi:MAG: YjbQ family protein [Epsilonproteobacteria bacterium]|nr:hypothetical protein [Campylobacterota bacterium]NPA57124.1 YjbQ family protein [Campylobacterota bacterium]